MNIQDIIAVLIISIPFLKMMVFDQDELNEKKQISIYLFIGILSWVIGIIPILFYFVGIKAFR